jgi:hypothetical protein
MDYDDSAFGHMPRRLRKHWHALHAKHYTYALHKALRFRPEPPTPKPHAKAKVTFSAAALPELALGAAAVGAGGAAPSGAEGLRQRRGPGRANAQHLALTRQRDELEKLLERVNEQVLTSEVVALRERLQRRAAAKDSGSGSGTGGGGTSGQDEGAGADALEKGRMRFVTAVRAQYQANHHRGLMRSSVLRALRESADQQLDHPALPLHDFDTLAPRLKMSPRLQRLARAFAGVPVVAALLNQVNPHCSRTRSPKDTSFDFIKTHFRVALNVCRLTHRSGRACVIPPFPFPSPPRPRPRR